MGHYRFTGVAGKLLSGVLLVIIVNTGAQADDMCYPLQISITADTGLADRTRSICGLSLNLPVGGNRRVTGLDLGIMSGAEEVKGIQANLLFNFTGLSDSYWTGVRGIQIAGLANMFMGADTKGVQIAGLYNGGGAGGVQVAGLMNSGMYDEFQISLINDVVNGGYVVQVGLLNHADSVKGLQCFGIYNSAENVSGIQFGMVNRMTDSVKGLDRNIRIMAGARDSSMNGIQLGIVNLADSAAGAQIGLLNRSLVMRGLQVGLINSADDLYGIQIGLLNHIQKSPVPYLPIVNMKF